MNENTIHMLALKMVPHIGDVQAKVLLDYFKDASAVFKAPRQKIEKLPGIGTVRASSIKSFKHFNLAERELENMQKHQIELITITDKQYPKRLAQCLDAPVLFFYKGTANLNAHKMISVIGTRNNTSYGKDICMALIDGLRQYNVTVVSGLAYGIDTITHQAALKYKLPTIGVLAHGFQQIYPAANRSLASEMTIDGGLITEFFWGTSPDKQNFPKRNRIVAGISDATIVIETSESGGSLITAELANGYNRDVFALPGRVNDNKSLGCNKLIMQNKAALIQNAADLIYMMGWDTAVKQALPKQIELFGTLTKQESTIVEILQKGSLHIDELSTKLDTSRNKLASTLLTLELQGLITSLPGSRYALIGM